MIEVNKVKIIHESPMKAKLFIDGLELMAVVSYQINASATDRPTITIVVQADVEIENKGKYDL